MDVLTIILKQGPQGLSTTMTVFFLTLLLSLPLSIIVVMLGRSPITLINKIIAGYIYFMRGTPLLLQLMFLFFGLPFVPVIGVALSRYQAVIVAFALNYAAYFAEILRGGIEGVSIGQWEAGTVLGLNKRQTFFHIILPQVFKSTIPAIGNEVITLLKDTSLVYILGLTDILKVANGVSTANLSFIPYIFVAGVYLLLTAVLTKIMSKIEEKANYIS
ncbi:MAG: amino acid ABC transporter permease [Tissierellia bacterium]|nr:amino acid ABC transporter permease [Tissierellia bacterium]